MQVTVSRVSPVEVSLRVLLAKDKVSTALDRAYNELGREAQLRGFRKGKVPRSILRQFFGPKVTEEVFRKLVDETLPDAIAGQKLELIGQPNVKADVVLVEGGEWSFTASMEVRPEIATIDLAALHLTRMVYPVTDAHVDAAVTLRREQNATLRTPEPSRPAQKGDTATFDYDLVVDGEVKSEFGARGRTAEIGTGTLLADINDALPGMSPGETREVSVAFPENARQSELAGKTVVVKLTVTALQEKVLPEVDDEFAKDLGSETLDELRAKLRADLERGARDRSDEELRNAAVEALVKQNPVSVPPSLVDQVLEQIRREVARDLARRGEAPGADVTAGLRADAEERVAAGLLLTELARMNGISVTEADLTARIDDIAKETGRAVQRVRAEYRDGQKRDALVGGVLEDKVIALLLGKATVTEETAAPDEGAARE